MTEDFPHEDIVNLPHPQSGRHTQMPLESRAAQFAPFAALTGHSDAIADTARRTDTFTELSTDQQLDLSRRLTYALSFPDPPSITITYFRPDARKDGGAYITVTVTTPKNLTEKQKELLRHLGESLGDTGVAKKKGLFR